MNEFRITLEDRPGSMAECCEAIGDAGINIIAGAGLASSTAVAALVFYNTLLVRWVFSHVVSQRTVSTWDPYTSSRPMMMVYTLATQ